METELVQALIRLLADLPSTALLAYLIYALVQILRRVADAHLVHVERLVTAVERLTERIGDGYD